jgi:hypothetical protein
MPINRENLTRMLLLYPAMTLKVVDHDLLAGTQAENQTNPVFDHPGETMRVN